MAMGTGDAGWVGSNFEENCAAMVGPQLWVEFDHRWRRGAAEVPTIGGRNAGWKGSNFEEKVPP